MKLAHIAPTSALGTVIMQAQEFHLCIASQVLADPSYAAYFLNAKGFVMMDVPTREEKKPEPYALDKLLRAIDLVHPNEVVLPDIWGGSVMDNVHSAEDAAFRLRGISTSRGPLGLVGCARGEDWESYLGCASLMGNIPGVTTLGVFTGTYEKLKVDRLRAVTVFSEKFTNLDIHLLGVVNDLSEIQNPQIRRRVRSADTAKLVRFGYEHKCPIYGNIPDYPGRGPNYFDRKTSELDESYITKNIRYWNKLVAR